MSKLVIELDEWQKIYTQLKEVNENTIKETQKQIDEVTSNQCSYGVSLLELYCDIDYYTQNQELLQDIDKRIHEKSRCIDSIQKKECGVDEVYRECAGITQRNISKLNEMTGDLIKHTAPNFRDDNVQIKANNWAIEWLCDVRNQIIRTGGL